MPCPLFEPTRVALNPKAAHARLPLLAEHDGLCHATDPPVAPALEWRFAGCNQGRDQEHCPRFPAGREAVVRRFNVQSNTGATLVVLVSEEKNHSPVRWREVHFSTIEGKLNDPPADLCEVAQIQVFCANYLQRFP